MSSLRGLSLAAAIAIGGCGASAPGQGAGEPEPEPGLWAGGASVVLDDQAELEASLHAVYHGSFERTLRDDGQYVLCIRPDAQLRGDAEMPARVCTPVGDIVGFGGPGPDLPSEGEGVAATLLVGGRELLVGAIPEAACAGDCRVGYEETLRVQIQCGDLSRHFSTVPERDLACSSDSDCVVLSSMCFDLSLHRDRAAPHRRVVELHGGTCLDPGGGACPPSSMRAACQEGLCAIVE